MFQRYAILIDGGFFFKKLRSSLKRRPSVDDVISECDKIREHDLIKGNNLLRIYYYDAFPATGIIANPLSNEETNLAQTDVYKKYGFSSVAGIAIRHISSKG